MSRERGLGKRREDDDIVSIASMTSNTASSIAAPQKTGCRINVNRKSQHLFNREWRDLITKYGIMERCSKKL